MPRDTLAESNIHPAIRDTMANHQANIVQEVKSALSKHAVVVVGMKGNPYSKKAQKALDAADVAHFDIIYGSYFGMWKERLALKMWTGWSTIPMIFVKGVLIGGLTDLEKLMTSDELKKMLA